MWPQLLEQTDNFTLVILAALLCASLLIARGLAGIRIAGASGVLGSMTLGRGRARSRSRSLSHSWKLRLPRLIRSTDRSLPMTALPAERGLDGHLQAMLGELEDAVTLCRRASHAQAHARATLDAAELNLARLVEEIRGVSSRLERRRERTVHAPYGMPAPATSLRMLR